MKIKKLSDIYKVIIFCLILIISTLPSYSQFDLTVITLDNPAPGYLLLDSYQQGYLTLIDNSGKIAFKKRIERNVNARCFSQQENVKLSYFARNKFYVVDRNLDLLDSFACKNGLETDFHDFKLLNNGHGLLLGIEYDTVDMSSIYPGGKPDAVLISFALQEQDENKNVVWEWHALDHLQVTDATSDIDLTQQNIAWVHINSFEVDSDGNLLISERNLDEITKIEKQSGNIIWRLGGKKCKNNQFTFLNDTIDGFWGFSHQHSVHRLPNGNILLFDNGNMNPLQQSRAVEYEIDEVNKTIRKVWEYNPFPSVYTMSQGSVERLPNGNTLIGWGTNLQQMTFVEVRADGTRAIEARNLESYMAMRYPIIMASKILFMQNSGNFNFNDSDNNTAVELNIQSLTGSGYVSTERHYYSPHNVSYENLPPLITYGNRWVLNNKGITGFTGKIIFRLSAIDSLKSPEKNKIYWRQQEGMGNFKELPTTYNAQQGLLEASISTFGEFILAEPQIYESPLLISPVNNSKKITVSPNFVWKNIDSAVSYRLQISNNIDFSKVLIDSLITSDTTFKYQQLKNNTTYFWRMKSLYDENESNWSDSWSFTTLLKSPELKYPLDENNDFSVKGIFIWNSVEGATYYKINISKTPDFDSLITDETGITDTIFNQAILENSRIYFWRIKAMNFDNESEWSVPFKLTTEVTRTLASPVLISPINDSGNVPLNGYLIWEHAENASSYNVELSIYPDFLNNILNVNGIDSAKLNYNDLAFNTSYYWHVKAFGNNDSSAWSDTWKFTTVKPNGIEQDFEKGITFNYCGNKKIIVNAGVHNLIFQFVMYDMTGRKVLTKNLRNNITIIDCSKLEIGVYFYFININSYYKTGKILIY
ncbi:MAG: hypothetical protein EPN82_15165 [Bacteroidetes bacterium]|nr:MAG: hypothetical protein EPN82_15165 [Bacteroidota bacterium]